MDSAFNTRARTLLFLVAAVATLWGLGDLSEAWGRDFGARRDPFEGVGLAFLPFLFFVGRVLLAWMPPGFPGEHGLSRRDSGGLFATWATSHLLGVAAFAAWLAIQGFLSSAFGIPGEVCVWITALTILALFAIAMESGPATMVPRHGMPGIERPSPVATVLLLATVAVALLPLAAYSLNAMHLIVLPSLGTSAMAPIETVLRTSQAGAAEAIFGLAIVGPATSAASFAATLVLLAHGLAAAHLSPIVRRLTLLLFALLPAGLAATTGAALNGFVATTPLLTMLLLGGTVFGYTSLRRADRRAATLSILAFTALPFVAPAHMHTTVVGMALAGLLSLLILTPPTGRARIAKLLFAAIVITIAAGILRFPTELFAKLSAENTRDLPPLSTVFTAAFVGYKVEAFGILFALVDATGLALIFRRPWRNGGGPRGANLPRPELAFVFMVALIAWILPMGLELVVEGFHPAARLLWNDSIGQVLVLLAGPGLFMVATGLPALFPAAEGEGNATE